MRRALSVMTSVVGSALLTLATVVATLLHLMFSTTVSDNIVYREGFFGSLFFKAQKTNEGAIGVTMGVANPAPLIITFVVYFVVLTMAQEIYRRLKQRREQLIKKRSGT